MEMREGKQTQELFGVGMCTLFGLAGPKIRVTIRTVAQPELHTWLLPTVLELRGGDATGHGERI